MSILMLGEIVLCVAIGTIIANKFESWLRSIYARKNRLREKQEIAEMIANRGLPSHEAMSQHQP